MVRKDYATAILLNIFIPGAGYIYAGRIFLGVVVLLLCIGPIAASLALLDGISEGVYSWTGLLAIIGAVDGYLTVKKHNAKFDADELIACPHCAEKIQRAAKLCRFCKREVAAAA